jgi:FolB domain-containing protein
MSLDIISINNLEFSASIGIHDHEKRNRQPIIVTLHLGVSPLSLPITLDQSIDYAEVKGYLEKCVADTHFDLIEELNLTIVNDLFSVYPQLKHVDIETQKPQALPGALSASVRMFRERT